MATEFQALIEWLQRSIPLTCFRSLSGGLAPMNHNKRIRLCISGLTALFCFSLQFTVPAAAQQTLGGITGAVTDTSGAALPDTTVTAVEDQTSLTRTQKTDSSGVYTLVDLPIGTYTLTFAHASFETQRIPSITVQANRTATVNATLSVGAVSTTVTVQETPLLNAVDTTNGYVMDKVQIDAVPLPTGSFTGLAILSPGVSAELPGGTGANSGLGNAPVWANGERDTSNTYLLNGVDARNLFNGKSTSQVLSARIVNNTGNANPLELSALPEQSSASVYLAIGEAIPTPAPETITEVRVNTGMYDAQQGATSGAHIDMSTASGTNDMHGSLYVHRGTNWLNAAPYFYTQDPNIPQDQKVPGLHRDVAGGTFGTPIIKNKLFAFLGYQYTYSSDAEIGISRAIVPTTLTDDRSPAGLATAANNAAAFGDPTILPVIGTASGPSGNDINPIAYTLFNYQLPNGQYLIPSANPNSLVSQVIANPSLPNAYSLVTAFPEDAEIPGTAVFHAYQGVANLDWNATPSKSFYAKYYYQHDPTIAPYAFSMYAGFPQKLDAGSQVISLSGAQTLTPNLSATETFGFIREKAYSTIGQPFTPAQFASACESLTAEAGQPASAAGCTINTFGSTIFPGISMVSANPLPFTLSYPNLMEIGATAQYMGAFTGVFQNRFNPSANAIWTHGKHTIAFGGTFSYTQLNTRDRRNQLGTIAASDFPSFLGGVLVPNYFYNVTALLVGNPNRYWRANEWGTYVQDKFQFKSNLNITLGLRLDDDRGLTEKYGHFVNFDPSRYSYNPTTDTISSNGLIVAGNNALAPTPGVSASTLTGRQWGLAPRIGFAWSPKKFDSKVVVRAGWGMYYDRGELFSYFSPAFTQNIVAGGPFGINQQQPFVADLSCEITAACAANGGVPTLENPWGNAADYASVLPSGNPATIVLPDAGALINGATPFYLGAYARNNKLPYSMNSSLDIQWQPRNDMAIDIGYVNGEGRHEVIPIPFNQPNIASPTNPLCGSATACASPATSPFVQTYTYGYTVQSASCPDYSPYANNCPINLPNGQPMLVTPEGGNVDLRVPYIGYAAESELYTAEGISNYNALIAHLEKRLSFGLQGGVSYTYSKSMDEQSGMGLFYTGNNPLDLRSGYGPSDFDRTNIFTINYLYEFPKPFAASSWKGKAADGWGLQGVIVLQSGQPYSIVDYSGAVGSIFYSIYDGVTNPIVPLDTANGCTAKNALTGDVGEIPGYPALKASCFTVPLLAPGAFDGAIPPGDTFETNFTTGQRNIFRQSWQKRADISLVKMTQLSDRFGLRFSFDVYNMTNHPSFDIPIVNVTQNLNFSQYPQASSISAIPGPALCASTDNAAGPFTTGNFYNCPGGLGQVTKTIGSPRQIQFSMALTF
jgi:Carboxypeptidase regulatory-like domain/TonB dependent receptor